MSDNLALCDFLVVLGLGAVLKNVGAGLFVGLLATRADGLVHEKLLEGDGQGVLLQRLVRAEGGPRAVPQVGDGLGQIHLNQFGRAKDADGLDEGPVPHKEPVLKGKQAILLVKQKKLGLVGGKGVCDLHKVEAVTFRGRR